MNGGTRIQLNIPSARWLLAIVLLLVPPLWLVLWVAASRIGGVSVESAGDRPRSKPIRYQDSTDLQLCSAHDDTSIASPDMAAGSRTRLFPPTVNSDAFSQTAQMGVLASCRLS